MLGDRHAVLAVELVIERHWGTPVRYVPWIALAALAWAAFRLWRGPTAREIHAAHGGRTPVAVKLLVWTLLTGPHQRVMRRLVSWTLGAG